MSNQPEPGEPMMPHCVLMSGVFCLLSGSALDLNFSDINVASLDKELEEQDNNVGLPSKYFQAQMVSS